MRCEIVAVGTELLLGQIVDTNSAWIAEQLALAGVDAHFRTTVGDNLDRLVDALHIALGRSEAVIVCGGLGPTPDDITREAIAEVMGAALRRDPAMEQKIRAMFGARGHQMPENNLKQADIPEGASPIPIQPGTAPGLVCPLGEKVIYAVPGVPWEMEAMVAGYVIADLRRRSGSQAVIRSRVIRTWGETESGLAQRLEEHITELDVHGNPTIAFLASGLEGLKIRATAKAASEREADRILDDEVERLRSILGTLVFSTVDRSMEEEVLELLRARGMTLATAESVTGGLVAARLTAVPGASDVLRGSIVAYAADLKFSLLGIPQGPVVSVDAAQAMAAGACRVLGSDCAVSTTGVAGPSELEGEPPGTVCLGWCVQGEAGAVKIRLPGDRRRVREYTTISVLDLLRHRVMDR